MFRLWAKFARADVFSLGACMYEAVTGLALFHRSSEYETMGAIVSDDPAPRASTYRRGIPRGLDDIIAKALEKDRDRRYASAFELQGALERFLIAEGTVLRARELGTFVSDLCAESKLRGPKVDTRPELWTRENETGRIERAAMRDALAQDLDAETARLEARRKRKNLLVGGTVLVVVLGLAAAVIRALQG